MCDIYFQGLVYVTVGSGKSRICKAGWKPGKFRAGAQTAVLSEILPLGNLSFAFSKTGLSADWMRRHTLWKIISYLNSVDCRR